MLTIRKPTAKALYCHHCAARRCIWPSCEDIAKAHKAGHSDAEIIAAIKSWEQRDNNA